jgi:hypothetical protein
MPQVSGEVGKMQGTVKQLEMELKKCAEAPNPMDRFVPVMSEFAVESAQRVAALQAQIKRIDDASNDLW